jgi:uncharacterized protein involved in exopolysaccharide biosynthesis
MAFRDLYARYDEDRNRKPSARRPSQPEVFEEVSRPSLLAILWRRKLLIAATMAVFVLGGLFYIAITPPRYLAGTSMLIDPRLGKSLGADPVQPGFIVDTGAIDSQIKLFTSQTVLSRVAKMANLANEPEFNGSERSLISRLMHPTAELESGVDLKTLEDAITIKRPERTYVVGIEVLARSPQKAAEIANDITEAYIEDQVTARVEAAQEDTKFVRVQLAKLSAEIKDAEDKVEDFKTKNNVVDTNGLRSNEQQVADLTKALGEARARTADAKSKLDELQRMQRAGHLDASGEAVKSLTIERLRQQQSETEQTVAKLAMTLGAKHPELMEARGRAAKVDALITDELKRLAISAAGDYQSARQNELQIAAQVDHLKGDSTELSRNLVPLRQMERNVSVLRSSYERFAQIRDNLSQQEADSPPGRVIAVARPPVSPARPKKTIVSLISVAAGLFFGLAAALFAEGTRPSQASPGSSVVYAAPTVAPRPTSPASKAPRRYWDDDDEPSA